MSLYTYDQEKVLFWAGKPTTILGILGSAFVCACIRNKSPSRRAHRRTSSSNNGGGGRRESTTTNKSCMGGTFNRFVFCVSLAHTFLCLVMAMSSIPTPKGSFYGSMGTEQTCSAMGFVSHFIFGFTLFYHGAIGYYYILTFFRGWTPRQFEVKVEPILHCIAVLGPLTGAIVGISTNMYHANPLLMNCWVAPAPLGCQYMDPSGEMCTEGGYHYRKLFVWLGGLIELNYYTVAKQAALVAIAITVYRQERKMNARYEVSSSINHRSSLTTSSTPTASNSNPRATAATTITRETLIQSALYFGSCSFPYMPMMIMRFLDLYWTNVPSNLKVPTSLYVFAVVAQILYPLQGPITVIAYTRPCMVKRRRQHPDESWWTCFYACCKTQFGCHDNGTSVKRSHGGSSTTMNTNNHSSRSITVAPAAATTTPQPVYLQEENEEEAKNKKTGSSVIALVDEEDPPSFHDEETPPSFHDDSAALVEENTASFHDAAVVVEDPLLFHDEEHPSCEVNSNRAVEQMVES